MDVNFRHAAGASTLKRQGTSVVGANVRPQVRAQRQDTLCGDKQAGPLSTRSRSSAIRMFPHLPHKGRYVFYGRYLGAGCVAVAQRAPQPQLRRERAARCSWGATKANP